jgi:hypothetical protein
MHGFTTCAKCGYIKHCDTIGDLVYGESLAPFVCSDCSKLWQAHFVIKRREMGFKDFEDTPNKTWSEIFENWLKEKIKRPFIFR